MTEIRAQLYTIEAEEDAGYEGSTESDASTLASSLQMYLEQNGRRYHTYFGSDKNYMPNDATEQSRLNIVHEIFFTAMGDKYCHAPVNRNEAVKRVLDLGTGTGIWAVDFACDNPHADVLGIDLSPIQPKWVPSNCKFEVDDFEQDWIYQKPFDFIHARTITQSVSDWPRLLREAYNHLTPGGWFEVSEVNFNVKCDDGSIPDDWPPVILFNHINTALTRSGGTPVNSVEGFKSLVSRAGFTEVQTRKYKIPSGVWPKAERMKKVGRFALEVVETGYEAYALALCTRVLGMPEDEVVQLCKRAAAAHLDRQVHAYWDCYVVYGKKPESV